MPSPFPCSPVIREWSWKKTHVKKIWDEWEEVKTFGTIFFATFESLAELLLKIKYINPLMPGVNKKVTHT